MTKETLAQIRERVENAWTAPWKYSKRLDDSLYFTFGSIQTRHLQFDFHGEQADAEFITHARQDIPALLTFVEQQQKCIAELESHRQEDTELLLKCSDQMEKLQSEITRLKAALEKVSELDCFLHLRIVQLRFKAGSSPTLE